MSVSICVFLLAISVMHQNGLIDLERSVPLLGSVEQTRHAQQGRQMRRVNVIGGAIIFECLFAVI